MSIDWELSTFVYLSVGFFQRASGAVVLLVAQRHKQSLLWSIPCWISLNFFHHLSSSTILVFIILSSSQEQAQFSVMKADNRKENPHQEERKSGRKDCFRQTFATDHLRCSSISLSSVQAHWFELGPMFLALSFHILSPLNDCSTILLLAPTSWANKKLHSTLRH